MVAPTKYKENSLFLVIEFCCRIDVILRIEGGSLPQKKDGHINICPPVKEI